MADKENNDTGVTDTSNRMLDGSEPEPIRLTGVEKADERAECEKLGISSCAVEQEMRNGSEQIAMESACVAKVDGEVCENLGISSCNIEDGMGSISLVSGFESSVFIGENGGKGEVKMDEDQNESSESESDNSSSPTSSSTSSTSSDDSSTSGSSSDDDDIEDNKEEGQQEKGEGRTENIQLEVEEGEIEDSDGKELVTETASDDEDEDIEDAELVTWRGINDDDDDGDEDDEDGTAKGEPIRSRNELKNLPPVPSVSVTLEPHHQMVPVGVVMSIISTQVIVEGVEKHDPLNEGSILWITESKTPLGLVDEIFGPVKNPYYIVRYNSESDVPKGIHGGTSVSFVPEFVDHVLKNKDIYKKGYDASGLNDEEVCDEFEFSDDEKEAEFRKMQKMAKRGNMDQNPGKQKNNKKKAPRGMDARVPPPTAPSLDHESEYRKMQKDQNPGKLENNKQKAPQKREARDPPYQVTPVAPSLFSPTSGVPDPALNAGVWTNGMQLLQPQYALLPNGLNPNGISWFPVNAQNPYQLPFTGFPFQQQIGPSIFAQQPNMFAQPMLPQGPVGQNQMPFGLNSHTVQLQPPPLSRGEQGLLPPNELQSERNNGQASHHRFRPGAFSNRGRKSFHQRGGRGWRPQK